MRALARMKRYQYPSGVVDNRMPANQPRLRICSKSESELRDILDQGGRIEYDCESHAKQFHLIVLYLHVCTIPMRSIMGQLLTGVSPLIFVRQLNKNNKFISSVMWP